MSTNKQRREASRRQLEIQLRERQAREARRRRATLVGSVAGTLVLIAVVVIVIVATSGGSKKTPPASKPSPKPKTSTSAATPTCGSATFPTKKAHAATGKAVSFDGVTVKGAADLTGKPQVTSHGTKMPTKLQVKDLVVGKGKVASPTSCVNVQYDGVLYKNGTEFDSSWKRGQLAQFSLTGVVPGFTQGIGGGTGIAPMHEGGRRIIIVPPAMGYGSSAQPGIPANSTLVFIVDLVKVV